MGSSLINRDAILGRPALSPIKRGHGLIYGALRSRFAGIFDRECTGYARVYGSIPEIISSNVFLTLGKNVSSSRKYRIGIIRLVFEEK